MKHYSSESGSSKKNHAHESKSMVDKGSYYGAGHGDFANLPQSPIMKDYPYPKHGAGEGLNDTITGIDETNTNTYERVNKHRSKSMY